MQMSHISLKICSSSAEGSFEAQIKLPKPVLTYVLAQCLNNLWLEFQENSMCSTCLKMKSRLQA